MKKPKRLFAFISLLIGLPILSGCAISSSGLWTRGRSSGISVIIENRQAPIPFREILLPPFSPMKNTLHRYIHCLVYIGVV